MKKVILVSVLIISSFKLVAQTFTNEKHYQAQEMYLYVNDSKGKMDSIIPKGENVTIDCNTFFKKMDITFKDANALLEHLYLTYSSGDSVTWLMQDFVKNTYRLKPGDINKGYLNIELIKNGAVISIDKLEGITPK